MHAGDDDGARADADRAAAPARCMQAGAPRHRARGIVVYIWSSIEIRTVLVRVVAVRAVPVCEV